MGFQQVRVFNMLESQPPEVMEELKARQSLPGREMERVVLQLKDICQNLTEDLLDIEDFFPLL